MNPKDIQDILHRCAEAAVRWDIAFTSKAERAYLIGRLEGITLGLLWAGALPVKELRPQLKAIRDASGKFSKGKRP